MHETDWQNVTLVTANEKFWCRKCLKMHSWVSKEQCDTQDQKKMTKMLCLLPVSVVINQHKVVSETNTQQLSYIFLHSGGMKLCGTWGTHCFAAPPSDTRFVTILWFMNCQSSDMRHQKTGCCKEQHFTPLPCLLFYSHTQLCQRCPVLPMLLLLLER